jgi:hypothetical protein
MAQIFYLIVLEVRHRHEMEVLAASSEAGGENPSWPFPASRGPCTTGLVFFQLCTPLVTSCLWFWLPASFSPWKGLSDYLGPKKDNLPISVSLTHVCSPSQCEVHIYRPWELGQRCLWGWRWGGHGSVSPPGVRARLVGQLCLPRVCREMQRQHLGILPDTKQMWDSCCVTGDPQSVLSRWESGEEYGSGSNWEQMWQFWSMVLPRRQVLFFWAWTTLQSSDESMRVKNSHLFRNAPQRDLNL